MTSVERPTAASGSSRLLKAEIAVVLLTSLLQSGVYAALDLLRDLFKKASLAAQTANLNSSYADNHTIDLLYQLAGIGFGVVPVLLVMFVLAKDGLSLRHIGFDAGQAGRDLGRGVAIAAVIGGSGLFLYLGAHAAGLALTVVPESLPAVWWRIPVLVASAAQNALVEEVVILGYLVRRLDQLGWRDRNVTAASALIRGSYHLYQGFGGFAGNAIMGVIFVRLLRRWGRVVPMFLAHTLIDTVAFVGYAELAGHVSWLPT